MTPIAPDAGAKNPVLDVLQRRGSCRRFADEALPDELVHRLVASAQRAPTDAAGQMYSFVRITDPELRERIAQLSGDQGHIRDAAEFFVVCADTHRLERLLEHRGESYGMGPLVTLLFGITDAALAAQSMALAAEAMGLGICYIGGLQNNVVEVAELLELPERVLPLWGLCVGVRADEPGTKPRVPTDLVLHENRFHEYTSEQLDRAYEAMASATRSGDWLNPVRKYFGEGGHMATREATFRALVERQGLDPCDGQK